MAIRAHGTRSDTTARRCSVKRSNARRIRPRSVDRSGSGRHCERLACNRCSDARGSFNARSRCRHRRYRRRRRCDGRNSCRCGSRRDPGRGGPAQVVRRFPDARSRSIRRAVSGVGRTQNQGQSDLDSARTLRGWRHDGQLDELVSHAADHARALGAHVRHHRLRHRRSQAVVRTDGSAARHRAVDDRAQSEQHGAGGRHREARLLVATDSAQRQRLLESWLLRHGMPDECEAVNARNDDSGSA